MNLNSLNQLNRRAPLNQAGQLVDAIPRDQLAIPDIDSLTTLLVKIRNKGLRDLIMNIVIIITVLYSSYRFYQSDAYLTMLTPAGQVSFIKNFGDLLLYLFKVTEFLTKRFSFAYNTINAVVPTYSTTLVMNFIKDPNGTINRYKTLGLKKTNMLSVGGSLLYGVSVNTGIMPGSSIITAGTKMSVKGMEMFIKKAKNMSQKDLERAYVTATVVGGSGFVRKYIESITGDVIRNAIVAVTSIVFGYSAQSVTSARMAVNPRRELERRLASANIPVRRINNGRRANQN
jgi:uncharacterized membrane protein YobD (UPF0266 family)